MHVNLLPALAQPEGAVLVCVKRSAGDAIADTFANAKQLKHQALVHRPLSFVPLVPVPAVIDYLSGTQEGPDAQNAMLLHATQVEHQALMHRQLSFPPPALALPAC